MMLFKENESPKIDKSSKNSFKYDALREKASSKTDDGSSKKVDFWRQILIQSIYIDLRKKMEQRSSNKDRRKKIYFNLDLQKKIN